MKKLLAVALAATLLVACSDSNDSASGIDATLLGILDAAGHTADPLASRTLPAITDPKAQLGMKLFYSKGLGGQADSACVSCHHPMLGGGDNLSLSIGVDAEAPDLLGPGRFHDAFRAAQDNNSPYDGGPTVPRNAPTTFNIGLWDQVLFHDGRVESLDKTPASNGAGAGGIRTPDSVYGVADPDSGDNLVAAQSRFPVTSAEEMRGFIFEAGNSNAAVRIGLEAKFNALAAWASEFTLAYGDASVSYGRIADAIGEYERSQVFVNTPWKAYVGGASNSISESAKRGAVLFFSSLQDGGANCVSCHAGNFFTDESFHVLAMPQIGRGKGNNNGVTATDDFGRFRETADLADKYRFRTPTLLNVEVTGPWGHAGGYTTLEAVVRHMLNPATALANYDFSQLNPSIQASHMQINTQFALAQLQTNRSNNVVGVHRDVSFSEADVEDLVSFLKTLTDPCVKDRLCLAPWIPGAADANPDGLRLNAVNNLGNFF
ncbi:MAG: cytochrome-c peroxidase [Gammaproteobacteria bacterium]|nr:cytochrome-c peroxidase [Gammaproteobacteria bacterium]MBL6998708.1 cytochrome-c peroxidase [Gammaproteobacteria bacterium]